MNLKRFTKQQLGLMKEDYEHFVYNEEYCKKALEILIQEIDKEIESRKDVFEISLMNVFFMGVSVFIVFFIMLIIADFAVSGTLMTLNYS